MSAAKIFLPKVLNFITSNSNKLAEVRAILSSTPATSAIELQSRNVPDLLEIQAASPEDVTRDKCLRAAEAVKGPVLVEDTCLVFDAWGGQLPGPYIKYFLTQLPGGVSSLHRLLSGFSDDKAATAICTFAYSPGPSAAKDMLLFQGRTKGRIVPARGPHNFGWDAAFEPCAEEQHDPSEPKTYAEMTKAHKNAISHRGRALAKLREWLVGSQT